MDVNYRKLPTTASIRLQRNMQISRGFAPIAREDACVLILGSMPGEESLRQRQYYAHPRNAFWPIMGRLFGANPGLDYPQRITKLILHQIAVWDVLQSCCRPGSLDAKICRNSIKINNFPDFFSQHPQIKRVYFNGKTAESYYRKQVIPALTVPTSLLDYTCLPSTSPAFASLNVEQKLAAWKTIKNYLDHHE